MHIQTFNKTFKFALLGAAKNDVRYFLNGILIDQRETGETVIVATDGHRMNHLKLITPLDLPYGQYILPREFIEMVLKSLSVKVKDDYSLEFEADEHGNFTISGNGGRWETRVIEGRYPDYQRVIPDYDNLDPIVPIVSFNPNYFLDAMKGAAVIGPKTPAVTMRLKDESSPLLLDIVCDPHLDIEIAFTIVMPYKR